MEVKPYWAGAGRGRVAHLVIREEPDWEGGDWPRSQLACGLVAEVDRSMGASARPHCKRCQEWALGHGLKEKTSE